MMSVSHPRIALPLQPIHQGVVMKRILRTAILTLAIAAPAVATKSAAQGTPELNNGKVYVRYVVPNKPSDPSASDFQAHMDQYNGYMDVYNGLKARRALEEMKQFLAPLLLPRPLILSADECSSPDDTPYYSSTDWTIHMCYGFIRAIERDAPKQTTAEGVTPHDAKVGLFAGVILHEGGHALFDTLNIPVFGREEDGADEVAAFIAVNFSEHVAREIIRGFAWYWKADRDAGTGDPLLKPLDPDDIPKGDTADEAAKIKCMLDPFCRYSDEHGTASQRMYNTVCIAYGKNRAAFQEFADKIGLPADRAQDCETEYKRVSDAFQATVMPFIDKKLMETVRSVDWLKAPAPAKP